MERLTFEENMGLSIDKGNDCPSCYVCWACDARVSECPYFEDVMKKLKHYEDMEEQGKLVILPCKPGDTIWDTVFGIPMPYEVTGFSFGDLNDDYSEDEEMDLDQIIIYYSDSSGGITGRFAESEIGKTVFLTEQEAYEALEKMKGEKQCQNLK